jgi:hypothetical protein
MRLTEGTGIAGANTLCKLLYVLISYCYGVYIEFRFNLECPHDGTHALRLYVFPMHHGQTEAGVGVLTTSTLRDKTSRKTVQG